MRCVTLVLAIVGLSAFAADQFNLSTEEQALLDATNKARAAEKLPPLAPSEKLFIAARAHSANMAKQNLLSHELDAKNVEDHVKATGYKYFNLGENIGFNSPTPEAQVEAWLKSPGHRANILNKSFTELGVGIAYNEQGQPYYTQVFGRPQSAGAPNHATVSVENATEQPLKISVPGMAAASLLQPGQIGQFTAQGGGHLPPLKVETDAKTRELPMTEGANYIIRDTDRGLEVRSDTPAVH